MFAWKSVINKSKLLKQWNTLAKQSGKSNNYIDMQQAFKISSLAQISLANQFASLPASQGSTRCKPPDFPQDT